LLVNKLLKYYFSNEYETPFSPFFTSGSVIQGSKNFIIGMYRSALFRFAKLKCSHKDNVRMQFGVS